MEHIAQFAQSGASCLILYEISMVARVLQLPAWVLGLFLRGNRSPAPSNSGRTGTFPVRLFRDRKDVCSVCSSSGKRLPPVRAKHIMGDTDRDSCGRFPADSMGDTSGVGLSKAGSRILSPLPAVPRERSARMVAANGWAEQLAPIALISWAFLLKVPSERLPLVRQREGEDLLSERKAAKRLVDGKLIIKLRKRKHMAPGSRIVRIRFREEYAKRSPELRAPQLFRPVCQVWPGITRIAVAGEDLFPAWAAKRLLRTFQSLEERRKKGRPFLEKGRSPGDFRSWGLILSASSLRTKAIARDLSPLISSSLLSCSLLSSSQSSQALSPLRLFPLSSHPLRLPGSSPSSASSSLLSSSQALPSHPLSLSVEAIASFQPFFLDSGHEASHAIASAFFEVPDD